MRVHKPAQDYEPTNALLKNDLQKLTISRHPIKLNMMFIELPCNDFTEVNSSIAPTLTRTLKLFLFVSIDPVVYTLVQMQESLLITQRSSFMQGHFSSLPR